MNKILFSLCLLSLAVSLVVVGYFLFFVIMHRRLFALLLIYSGISVMFICAFYAAQVFVGANEDSLAHTIVLKIDFVSIKQ